MRVRLQAGNGTVARGARKRAKRHARYIHTIRPYESQSRFLDAHDYKIQVHDSPKYLFSLTQYYRTKNCVK